MQTKLHPQYNKEITIVCASCKAEYHVGSTHDSYTVEVCANCHPFYTGKQGFKLDTENRIKKFEVFESKADQSKVTLKKKKTQERTLKTTAYSPTPKVTLKDMLKQLNTKKG